MHIAGLVCGILAAVGGWIPGLNFVAPVIGIVGIVLSVMGKKKLAEAGQPTGVATAGLVLSIIGLALAIIGLICTVCLVSAVGGAASGLLGL